MTTKESIIENALALFAKKGYNGTSVKEIATAVGIKDSSLYKHFHSKQEIFDTIVEEMAHRMEEMSINIGLTPESDIGTAAAYYGNLTEDGLLALSRQFFLFYLKDPFVARFRRMATIEQYNNEAVYGVYDQIFLQDSVRYLSLLFQEMIRQGQLDGSDPKVMAIHFYAPIFFLLCKYDQKLDAEEEALTELNRQILEFCRIYRFRNHFEEGKNALFNDCAVL